MDIESGDEVKNEEDIEEDAYIDHRRHKVAQDNSEFFSDLKRKEQDRIRARLDKERAQNVLPGNSKKDRESEKLNS